MIYNNILRIIQESSQSPSMWSVAKQTIPEREVTAGKGRHCREPVLEKDKKQEIRRIADKNGENSFTQYEQQQCSFQLYLPGDSMGRSGEEWGEGRVLEDSGDQWEMETGVQCRTQSARHMEEDDEVSLSV